MQAGGYTGWRVLIYADAVIVANNSRSLFVYTLDILGVHVSKKTGLVF